MADSKYDREVKAADDLGMELDAAMEASFGSYCEPSCFDHYMVEGNTIEVAFKNGGRYRLKVEEIAPPQEEE
jgi:hypothetical protein